MTVHIKELPNGLGLRSTSWYEIDAKMKEYTKWYFYRTEPENDPEKQTPGFFTTKKVEMEVSERTVFLGNEFEKTRFQKYEFIEDHIEIGEYVSPGYGARPDLPLGKLSAVYIITLKKLDKNAQKE